jgi:dTDP-4-dehydrorhamnose reductase
MLLITGASGYLGRHLVARAGARWRLSGTHLRGAPPTGLDSRQLEVRDAAAVERLLRELQPQVVLHTAYQRDDPSVTIEGTRNLARSCGRLGARLMLVSTDLVFDGRRGQYRESDPTSPVESYGASKVEAEREVLAQGGVVARTSLIYGFNPLDPITEKLVVKPLQGGEPSTLFLDELRCPVYAPDLADALLELASMEFQGLIHLSGPQRLNRYELGVRLAHRLGLDPSGLRAGRAADLSLLRPADCSLDTSLARRLLKTRLRSVDEVVAARGQQISG